MLQLLQNLHEMVKAQIHSNIIEAQVNCAGCGNKMVLRGAFHSQQFTVESCYRCHSAYTGKRQVSDTGAVEKFKQKFKGFSNFKKK